MIAPSARLITGHEAPKRERRHGQHTAIMPRSGPARHANQLARTPRRILRHPETGHGADTGTRAAHPPPDAGP